VSIIVFQVSSEIQHNDPNEKFYQLFCKALTLKSNGSFVSVTKEVGVPEDLEVRSCKRFFLLDACLQNES